MDGEPKLAPPAPLPAPPPLFPFPGSWLSGAGLGLRGLRKPRLKISETKASMSERILGKELVEGEGERGRRASKIRWGRGCTP